MPKVTMMLLAAVPVLVQSVQLSQAVMLDGMPAPRRWMGHNRPLSRKRPLVRMARALISDMKNDINHVMPMAANSMLGRRFQPPSETPMQQFEHIGTRIEQVLPNLKMMHEAEQTGVQWMGNVSDLVAALTDLKKVFVCYQGTSYIGDVLTTARTLKEQNVISDVKTRADAINKLFLRLGKLAQKYETLVPTLEEQGFISDMIAKFFVMEHEMLKGGGNWKDIILKTTTEIMQSVGEQDGAAKRTEFKDKTLLAVTEIESAAKEPEPVKPTGAKPDATVPEEPVEPPEPAEPQKWTYLTNERYAAAFAEYQETRTTYEGNKQIYYTTLADWAKQKELETIWALYDTDVELYGAQATTVKKTINDMLVGLVPTAMKCQLHPDDSLAAVTEAFKPLAEAFTPMAEALAALTDW